MLVRYIGRSDVRTVTPADLPKLGVEGIVFSDLHFTRRGVLELPDNLGEVLVTHRAFAGQFRQVSQPVEEVPVEVSPSSGEEALVDDTSPSETTEAPATTGKKVKNS